MGCVGLRMLEMSSGSGFAAECEAGGSMSPLQDGQLILGAGFKLMSVHKY